MLGDCRQVVLADGDVPVQRVVLAPPVECVAQDSRTQRAELRVLPDGGRHLIGRHRRSTARHITPLTVALTGRLC